MTSNLQMMGPLEYKAILAVLLILVVVVFGKNIWKIR